MSQTTNITPWHATDTRKNTASTVRDQSLKVQQAPKYPAPAELQGPGKFSDCTAGAEFPELSDPRSHTNLFPFESKPLQPENKLIDSKLS